METWRTKARPRCSKPAEAVLEKALQNIVDKLDKELTALDALKGTINICDDSDVLGVWSVGAAPE